MDEEERGKVALHEAGHTAMRYWRGLEMGAVCIHPDGTGMCAAAVPGDGIRLEDAILVTIAGPIGEVGSRGTLQLDAAAVATWMPPKRS